MAFGPNIGGQVDQVIAMGAGAPDSPQLTVFVGTPHAEQAEGAPRLLRLDDAIWVFGDSDVLQEAVQRSSRENGLSELALKAKELSQTYDNWFVLLKPLARAVPNRGLAAAPPMHSAADLIEMVEEVSGGIRLGPYSEVRIEVVLKTADDAFTLAGLGRWLPGLLQLMEPDGMPARMVELAENLRFQAAGRTASMSFTISEENAKKLLKTVWRGDIVE